MTGVNDGEDKPEIFLGESQKRSFSSRGRTPTAENPLFLTH